LFLRFPGAGVVSVLFCLAGFCFSQGVEEISAQEAARMVEKGARLVDVRTIAEYTFVGHPEKACNIPLLFWKESEQRMVSNPHFLDDLRAKFTKEETLVFICRSGGRSMRAARRALEAGFSKVYSVSEGFEGKLDEQGYRSVDGWKNKLPYTYRLDEEYVYRKKESAVKHKGGEPPAFRI